MNPALTRVTCVLVLLVGSMTCSGCDGNFVAARDADIAEATRGIETSRDDAQRAKAYSARGSAYSEKARYSRLMKQISAPAYERLFDLAIQDHDRAIALAPGAETYFNRAQAYYDRGAGDLIYDANPYAGRPRHNPWLTAAARDFELSIARDPRNSLALDRLGLTYESNGESDKAIAAYTRESVLDSRLGKLRLADIYCVLGYERQLRNDLPGALQAYQKSIEFGTADDKSCPVEPSASIGAIKSQLRGSAPPAPAPDRQ